MTIHDDNTQLRQRCAELERELKEAKNRVCGDELYRDSKPYFDLQMENARLRTSLGFFMSVIKSGEPWTETCEEMRRKALEGDE